MVTIYPQSILSRVYDFGCLSKKKESLVSEIVALAKFFITNGSKAIEEFNRGSLRKFDPLVRDGVCQRHAVVVLKLFKDREVQEEMQRLQPELKKLNRLFDRYTNKSPEFHYPMSFGEVVGQLKLGLQISRKVEMLFFAHLLTIAASFSINEPRDVSYVMDYDALRDKLSKKLEINLIKQIVGCARTAFSHYSAEELPILVADQLLRERVSIRHPFSIEEGPTHFTVTNAFYSMEAALRFSRQEQIPLLIKEYRVDQVIPQGLFYRYVEGNYISMPRPTPEQPVMVIKGILGTSLEALAQVIAQIGLQEVIMMNASLCVQFKTEDKLELLDEQGRQQIETYRERAKRDMDVICIVHVHPSTAKEEQPLGGG